MLYYNNVNSLYWLAGRFLVGGWEGALHSVLLPHDRITYILYQGCILPHTPDSKTAPRCSTVQHSTSINYTISATAHERSDACILDPRILGPRTRTCSWKFCREEILLIELLESRHKKITIWEAKNRGQTFRLFPVDFFSSSPTKVNNDNKQEEGGKLKVEVFLCLTRNNTISQKTVLLLLVGHRAKPVYSIKL